MKLLVDACAGAKLAAQLRQDGHDTVFVGDWPKNPEDDEILETGLAEQRVVITRDKDFGTLAVRDRQPHCGIVRLVELPPDREFGACVSVLARHADDLARGALITAEVHRVRVRQPEGK